MGQFLLVVVAVLIVGGVVFGVVALSSGADPGLAPADPDSAARRLPGDRPLVEADMARAKFDTGLRGYRMAQVDAALARIGYDLGYKHELIEALMAEVAALRDGREDDADVLRAARQAAARGGGDDPLSGRPRVQPPLQGDHGEQNAGHMEGAGGVEGAGRHEESGGAVAPGANSAAVPDHPGRRPGQGDEKRAG